MNVCDGGIVQRVNFAGQEPSRNWRRTACIPLNYLVYKQIGVRAPVDYDITN